MYMTCAGLLCAIPGKLKTERVLIRASELHFNLVSQRVPLHMKKHLVLKSSSQFQLTLCGWVGTAQSQHGEI